MTKFLKNLKHQPHIKTMTKTIIKKHKNKTVVGKKVGSLETLKKKEKVKNKVAKVKKAGKVKKALRGSKNIIQKDEDEVLLKEKYDAASPWSLLLDTSGNLTQEDTVVGKASSEDQEEVVNLELKAISANVKGHINVDKIDGFRGSRTLNNEQLLGNKKGIKKAKHKKKKNKDGKIGKTENYAEKVDEQKAVETRNVSNERSGIDKELQNEFDSEEEEVREKHFIADTEKKSKSKTSLQNVNASTFEKERFDESSEGAEHGSRLEENKIGKRKNFEKKEKSKYKLLKQRERELALDLFGSDEGVAQVAREAGIETSYLRTSPEGDRMQKKHKLVEDEEDEEAEVDIPNKVEPKRKAAWIDEDDENIRVMDVVANMTKARGSRGIRETSTKKYERELRDKFEQVYGGTPEWADLDRKPEEDSDDDELVRTTGDYLSKNASVNLPRGRLEYKLMEDLNSAHTEGAFIQSIDFNPHLQVGLVAGSLKHVGAATLYQVDGKINHRIHSVRFPNYYLTCARFMRDGKKFVAGSSVDNHFYVYDMESSKETRIVWKKKIDKVPKEHFYTSPDGELLVFFGHGGKIFLYDTETLSIVDIMQAPHIAASATFNSDGSRMYTFGTTGDICIWDMHARECVHKFYDEGCISGSTISMSPNDQYLACGSKSGVVNIYDVASLSSVTPQPVKALLNLTTSVTSLSFNSSSEVLAMASNRLSNALKLVHFPSMTVFENFPIVGKTTRPVESLQFSPQSGFLAVGNKVGSAQLFRLKHFKSY
ncbi:U3 snoRNP protein [Halocaridina rubra]|uniref:U3 snoRNP protein n=1 Tax=Halocaridina rubra TaxID=373956 RepID=A0AAN8XFB0_HALRR